jgi:hypothetical protein
MYSYVLHYIENPNYEFPEKEMRGLITNFHIHVSVRDLYIPRIGPHIKSCGRIGRPIILEYINRSQTHECGNWDGVHVIPFLGMFVSNSRYFDFAVCISQATAGLRSMVVGLRLLVYGCKCVVTIVYDFKFVVAGL